MDTHSRNGQKSLLKRLSTIFAPKIKSSQDLLALMRGVASLNILEPEALAIVEGAIQIADLQVRDIMVPRSKMASIKVNAPLCEFLPEVITTAHSRFPVLNENSEEVIGILLAKDLLPLILEPQNWSSDELQNILRPAIFVPESKRLNVLLRDFRANHNHMAVVIDEYANVAGIVTIEDVLEQIVGDIEDEYDVAEDSYIKTLPCGDWLVKTITPLHFLYKEISQLEAVDLKQDANVGDLVAEIFGYLPHRNETAEFGGFKIRILSADSRKVHLIRISKS